MENWPRGNQPACDPLTWPLTHGASLGWGQETTLQALGTPERLCSAPWELPSRASVVLLLRGDVSLQLS